MGLGAIIASDKTEATDLMESGVVDFIEIHERLGETTYYSIQFRCDIKDGDIALLTDTRIAPNADLAIIVVDKEKKQECLVRGPVFSQEITLKNGGDGSMVMVKGADTTLAMDREFKSLTFEGADSAAVEQIITAYSLTPDVIATTSTHTEQKHNLVQRSTDLQFVRKLARRNGYKFWVTCDPEFVETAHFKRLALDEEPVADLKINQDDFNLNELHIAWDVHRPSNAQGNQVDLANKQTLTGSVPLSPQNPLGGITQQVFAPQTVTIDLSAPVDDQGDLTARLEAAMIDASYFIHATCETSVHQLGKVIRAATLVNLIGAGTQHSGKYLVAAVTHRINETEHKMNLELIRNALGPTA